MSKILPFPTDTDPLKFTSYTSGDDPAEGLGVATLDKGIEIMRLNDSEFLVITPEGSTVHKRESLSEFVWLAALFLDEEERHRPEGSLIACDY